MAVSEDWQIDYAGLTVGGASDFGLVAVTGMLDLPSVRKSDNVLLRRHGKQAGGDFLGERTITLELDIYGASTAAMQSRVDEFAAAFTTGDEQALTFQLPGAAGGGVGRVMARVRKRKVQQGLNLVNGLTRATVQLVATDPRIYTDLQQSAVTGLPVTSGGVTFNATFNATFGTTGTSGSILTPNNGSFSAPVSLKIVGPVTDPSVENLSTGEILSFTGTISAGTYYIVNTADRTVLLNGTASRYSELDAASTWLQLRPGVNDLQFRADAFHADASLTATWRSAFI